jgi:hypothetical protein
MLRVNHDYVWLMDQTAARLPLRSSIHALLFVWLSFGIPDLTRCGRELYLLLVRVRRSSVSPGCPFVNLYHQEGH